ncbi:MAG: hypothetical protein NC131_10790 [Roseburia sp.]|nr:hypothetical protein [Roseburia sp.]
MALSKREARYRTKAIQECRLKKDEQRLLDAVVGNGLTYARFYRDEAGVKQNFLFGVYMRRVRQNLHVAAADAMRVLSEAMHRAAESTEKFGESLGALATFKMGGGE